MVMQIQAWIREINSDMEILRVALENGRTPEQTFSLFLQRPDKVSNTFYLFVGTASTIMVLVS